MKTLATLLFLAGHTGTNKRTAKAFTTRPFSIIVVPPTTILSSSRYDDDGNYGNRNYYGGGGSNNNDDYGYYNGNNNMRGGNSMSSSSIGSNNYMGGNSMGGNSMRSSQDARQQQRRRRSTDGYYDGSSEYNGNGMRSDDYYSRGGGTGGGMGEFYSRPRIASSGNFRRTSRDPREMVGRNAYDGGYGNNEGGYGQGVYSTSYSNNNYRSNDGYSNDNYQRQGRGRGNIRDMDYSNKQGLSEDFRMGIGGGGSSMTTNQRNRNRNRNNNRIQDYYTPGQREMLSQQQMQSSGLQYGGQPQYDTDRGNTRRGSSSDFRRGSARTRIQDYATPREREMRQMRDNRALGRGDYENDGYGGGGGGDYNRGERGGRGYADDNYPDYGYGRNDY